VVTSSQHIITDHFRDPGKAIGPMCVCLCTHVDNNETSFDNDICDSACVHPACGVLVYLDTV